MISNIAIKVHYGLQSVVKISIAPYVNHPLKRKQKRKSQKEGERERIRKKEKKQRGIVEHALGEVYVYRVNYIETSSRREFVTSVV